MPELIGPAGREDADVPDELCVRCGAGSELWTDPVVDAEENRYCCPACMHGEECGCASAIVLEEAPPR